MLEEAALVRRVSTTEECDDVRFIRTMLAHAAILDYIEATLENPTVINAFDTKGVRLHSPTTLLFSDSQRTAVYTQQRLRLANHQSQVL